LRDWRVFGAAEVSYGYDLENSWLLPEAAVSVGRERDPAVLAAALSIGSHSADWGFDAQQGGYFEAGPLGGASSKLEKIWWVQCEALPALLRLYLLTHEEKYLSRFEATLSFIEIVQRDAQYGELYWGILADRSVGPHGTNKG